MTALMTPKQINDVADELIARVGVQTEYAIYDWLDEVCANPFDRRRLLLSVASMLEPDPGYDALIRERFDVPPIKDLPRPAVTKP